MKVLCIAIIGFCLGLAAAKPADEEAHYTTKYDNIDVMEILKSERSLNAYFDCLMDKGKCTPEGKELKDRLGDALKTGCAKCNDTQKEKAEKVIKYLTEKKPDYWKQLKEKFDPENVYAKKYEKEAQNRGIHV